MGLGTFWGISAGAGDPDWLTVKGAKLLRSVKWVACPQNSSGQPGLAFQIVRPWLQPEHILIPLHLPFVTQPDQLQAAWRAAAEQLAPPLEQGEDVAFVCEGDVGLYSTFAYVARALQARIPNLSVQAIPGVASPLAAAALLGSPLVLGSEKLAILPALFALKDLEQACAWAEVVVLMKVAPVYPQVWQWLAEKSWLNRASLVVWAGWPQQVIFPTLERLANYQPPYFSLLILRSQTRN
ncbi:precorrin-2 C(20)-methyltransferase [Thermostichus vulcanus]|uniref:Precorrin-2 C(20)-methyltransferase n=1 Tax=Thermostichus vulcanus str. 'Rupite' TaxID=2813851 RepID=A0ABT0CFC8_THEVL|nr:precorrin-2 C(20)-methyltransferase [Thermostichus vulcanus]MCJ2544493.1 precorrin-2 C(20)-methyltransferase [Thermostichus vulcanus str. 'Rupite']